MVLGTIQSLPNAIHLDSFNGGIQSSPTQPRNSRTVPCVVPTLSTLGSAVDTTFRMSQIWSSLSWTLMIPREYLILYLGMLLTTVTVAQR